MPAMNLDRFGRSRRPGIASVLEVLLAAGVLALLVTASAGLYTNGLDRVKTRQAGELLGSLDRAVRAYGQACGTYPPGSADGALRRVLPQLLGVDESRRELSGVSPVLLFSIDGRPHCQDPWGVAVRCFTTRTREPRFAALVQRNDGVPVFESAGPDRDFGDSDAARQADNVRSDEPSTVPVRPPQPSSQPDVPSQVPAAPVD
jgi:type II secretory pathway pseudopilin PulG